MAYDERGSRKSQRGEKGASLLIMILKQTKEVKKQVKRVNKEAEKISKKFSGKEYDTNVVLLKMDRIENELKALRELVNREKERAYIEKMGGILPKKQ